MRKRLRADRGTVASSGILVVLVGVLLAAALHAEGFRTPDLDLHDAGVWVTRTRQAQLGRVNSQILQIDLRHDVANSSVFDVLQSEDTVLIHRQGADGAGGSLTSFDGRTAEESPQPIDLPARAEVSMGGPPEARPTLAIVDPDTGDVWVGPAATFVGQRLVATEEDDEPLPPSGNVAGARYVAVGTDGQAFVYAPESGDVQIFDAAGAATGSQSLPAREEDHAMQVAAVGDRFLALDLEDEELLSDGAAVDLADFGAEPQLQQSSVDHPAVLVATDAGLVEVDGDEAVVLAEHAGGRPARPVYLRRCSWGAWASSQQMVRLCDNQSEPTIGDLPTVEERDTLRFRTNRGKLVLNAIESGETYLLGEADPLAVSWAQVDEVGQDELESDQQETIEQPEDDVPQDPEANDDLDDEGFATRPGRAVVIDPMRNDEDPNRADVLVIAAVELLSPSDAPAPVIIDGGMAVQVTPPPSGETVLLRYTIDDGTGRTDSADASVEVRDGPGAAPLCDRTEFGGEPQTTRVRAGAGVSHNVLAEARDPDGDTVSLIGVDHQLDETATANPDGTVVYQPPGIGVTGERQLTYHLQDETGEATECVLTVTILGPQNPDEEPTARPDHATTEVGREAVLDVLANDSDPDGSPLRVTSVDPFPGAAIDVDSAGRVHILPSQVGPPIYTTYYITDGPNTAQGRIRVDVTPPAEPRAPIAVRDDVVLRVGQAAIVDVLANDTDANGDVLVVTTVDVPADIGLTVEVVEHRYLRITTADGQALPEVADFAYIVTDGINPARGTVVVRPGPLVPDQSPTANINEFTVRAGTIAALDVLANDSDPEGQRLSVRLPVDANPDDIEAMVFAQGDLLRFRAPAEPGRFEIVYEAVDPGLNAAQARAIVHVAAADAANNRPRPIDQVARTVAGVPVTITLPVATMDPDGDPVVLLGIGSQAPAHGSITSVSGDRLEYLPDLADTDADGRPEGFFGTDTFTYRVRDSLGAEAEATIQVGVAEPAGRNSPPVAIDDVRVVPVGSAVPIDVVRNDSDPDGDEPRLDDVAGLRQASGRTEATIVDGKVQFDASELTEGEFTISYTVTDGVLTDVGFLTVRIGEEENLLPIAVDDVGPTAAPGETVMVAVLDNDSDPDGDRELLEVLGVEPTDDARVTEDDRGLEITVPASQLSGAVTVVYTVVDVSGGESRAVVRVPVADEQHRRPVAPFIRLTTDEGEPVGVDVLEETVVSTGREKVLFEAIVDRGNGTCAAAGSEVTFTPNPGFVGTSGCTFEVGDGPGDDPETLRAFGMVSITVERTGNTPPVTTEQPLTVVADDETARDLTAAVFDPDGDELTFDDIEGETDNISASIDGPVITIRADDSAEEGEVATITYTVTDGHSDPVPGVLIVVATEFSGALAVAVTDPAQAYEDEEDVRIPVLDNDQQGANEGELSLVEGGLSSGANGEVVIDGRDIIFTPTPGTFGPTSFTYLLNDGTDREERFVEGLVTVNVIGRPDAPPAPAVVRESQAITLSWGAPAPNGAPIQYYLVEAVGGPGQGVRRTNTNTFRFDGLTNGEYYQFRIAAVNDATLHEFPGDTLPEAEFSALSERIQANAPPPIPNAPQAAYGADDHGGTQLSVTWQMPQGDGTDPVEYELQISPPPSGGQPPRVPASSQTIDYTATGLTNGVAYTFRVKAYNLIQEQLTASADFSAFSNPEIPATQPNAPSQPQVAPNDGYVDVTWAAVTAPADNGDAVENYYVQHLRGGTVVGESPALGADTSYRVSGLTNGDDYTFQVRAENKAGTSPYSVQSPPAEPFGIPSGTTNVTATEGDNDSVLTASGIDWNGDGDDPGDTQTWQFSRNGGGWTDFAGPGTAVPAPNDGTYTFQVRGCNRAGCAASNGATSNQVRPFGSPGVPNCCSGGGGGTNTLTWNWSPPNDNGHDSLTYRVFVNGALETTTASTSYSRNMPTPGMGQPAQCVTVSLEAVGNRTTPAGRTTSARSGGVQRCGPAGPPPPQPSVSVSRGAATTAGGCVAGDAQAYDSGGCYLVRITMTDFSPGNHTVNCYMTMNSGNPDVYASFTAGNGTHNQCSFSSAGRWVWVIVDGVITSHCACANQAANAQNNHSGTMSNISEQWPA